MAKFDIRTQATKPLYAGVGATDLAVEAIRDYVSEGRKRIVDVQKNARQPKVLRDQAVTRVNARVDALAKAAEARRTAVEKRVSDLQSEATGTVNGAYSGLVSRGESLVTRIRRQESTQATKASARTTTTKAKTTRTQATKGTKATAKKTSTTARKTAAKQTSPAQSSAKATSTAAKKTASNAAQAATDAASKVGD